MKYAVIAIGGSQFKVTEGQVITTTLGETKKSDTQSTDQVLLTVDDAKVTLGNPLVKGATVEYQIENNYSGDKIRVFKYKAKSRYRKTMGFRANLTDIKITKINL